MYISRQSLPYSIKAEKHQHGFKIKIVIKNKTMKNNNINVREKEYYFNTFNDKTIINNTSRDDRSIHTD